MELEKKNIKKLKLSVFYTKIDEITYTINQTKLINEELVELLTKIFNNKKIIIAVNENLIKIKNKLPSNE